MADTNAKSTLDRLIRLVKESKDIPAVNKKLILEYDAEREARGIGANGKVPSSRINFLRVVIALNSSLKKPFKKMKKQELIAFVNGLAKMKKKNYGKALELKQMAAEKGSITSPEVRTHFGINRFYARVLMNNIAKECPDDFKLRKGRTAPTRQAHTLVFTGKDKEKFRAAESQRYAPKTINTFKSQLKCFFKWMDKEDVVEWMKVERDRATLPKDIYFPAEILTLIGKQNSVRNRAIISVLYESGARASEFLGLNVGSMKRDKYSYIAVLSGKTGDRPVRLIKSIPYIAQWLSIHPFREEPDAPLWVAGSTRSEEKARLGINNLNRLLKKAARQAGFKKKVYPHLFRHSRLTELAKMLTESELRLFAGWGPDSDMVKVYVHLSHRDLDKAILKKAGLLEKGEEEEDVLKPKVCEICNNQNPPTEKFCLKCSTPLDIKTALEIERREDKALAVMQDMLKNIKELERKGIDFKQFGEFMESWVKAK
ncbi:MAG: site-specific integrase [Candidatus Diapherotrites archaeon]